MRELLDATRVTLHADKTPARETFASLYRQAGATTRPASSGTPNLWDTAGDEPVTVRLDNVPFWDAVREVERQTGLTLMMGTRRGMLLGRPPPALARGPVATHGPFLIVAHESRLTGGVERVRVFVEPKIRITSYARRAKVIEAHDEAGRPLRFARSDERAELIYWNGGVLDVEVPPPAFVSGRMVHLKGSITADVIARTEICTYSDDVWYSKHFNQFGWRFSMRLFPAEGGRGYLLRMWNLPRWNDERDVAGLHLTLLDANGTALTATGREPVGFEWRWSFVPSGIFGEPKRLVVEVPRTTRTIEIPFEFGQPPKPKP